MKMRIKGCLNVTSQNCSNFVDVFVGRSSLCLMMLIVLAVSSLSQSAEPSFQESYDKENDRTAVYLKPIEIPNNSRDFSVGAAYEYKGPIISATPCCMTVFFGSIGKKNFEYKENHSVTFWADGTKIETEKPFWKESDGGTAFVISQIAFPEQVWIGMKTEQFLKLVRAKKVKIQVGKFKFEMTEDQRKGFAAIAERFEQIGK